MITHSYDIQDVDTSLPNIHYTTFGPISVSEGVGGLLNAPVVDRGMLSLRSTPPTLFFFPKLTNGMILALKYLGF